MCSKALQRLSTFAQWPIPSDVYPASNSNFVPKAAGAYFQRTEDCVKDEVKCKSCGVQLYDWNTDSPTSDFKLYKSPAAVHRAINPKCPALNPSDSDEVENLINWQANLASVIESPYAKYVPRHLQASSMTPEHSSNPTRVQTERAAVQRVLFPESPEQNQPDQEDDYQDPVVAEIPQSTAQSNAAPQPCVLDQTPITHPLKPKSGNYDHLFASHRLQTFPNSSTKHQRWAEDGFIHRTDGIMCVYCGTVLVVNGHQPDTVHRKVCPSCPFVMGVDVGNITQEQEKFIRLVYFKQQAARTQSDFEMEIKYVQYQDVDERLGSFQGWPKMFAKIFPAPVMASAGFFYSGCSDKVMCYSCGVELYDWGEEADVCRTHATVSPTCLHLINTKGQDFIAQATNLQVQAEVKYPKDSSPGEVSSSGGVVGEEPGCPVLDMTAVKAALACGYTLQQIQDAIVKFFGLTSRYPNEAILKASLKAADESHITIIKQEQVVLQQGVQLQQKDTQLQRVVQEKDRVVQEHGQLQSVVQQKDSQLQRVVQEKDRVVQEKDRVVQEKDTQLQSVVQQKDSQLQRVVQEKEQTVLTLQNQLDDSVTQLSEKEEQLSEKEEQLSEKEEQLRWQDQQIRTLMQQVERLRADRHHSVPQDAAGGANAMGGEGHSVVCKICMSDKPRMIFLPCGHVFSCAECTSRLPDRRCPVCRQDITEVLPAFVA